MYSVSISNYDWSLHRKGIVDQARHREKVKEAIRENLADIVSEQSIVANDGKKIVRVPLRSLEQYKFRYDPNDPRGVGQGDGNTSVGDVLKRFDKKKGQGQGQQAGDQPGEAIYEARIDLASLERLVFEDFELPFLEQKRQQQLETETIQFNDVRRIGAYANLDKRRTIRANILRNALQGHAEFSNVSMDDLRYRTWEPQIRRESNAAVIAMMDVSGSMGEFEKQVSRAFYFWMVQFLRTKYDNVQIAFVSHHTEAAEVTEEEFFSRAESGGTKVSSAYRLALDILSERFNPVDWNVYPFHFSDGDNFISDNEECLALAEQLAGACNMFGYGEVRQRRRSYQSTLMSAFQNINVHNFVKVTISEQREVYSALKSFFSSNTSKEVKA